MSPLQSLWGDYADSLYQLARLIKRESGGQRARVWTFDGDGRAVPRLTHCSAGALWWHWLQKRRTDALLIEIGQVARGQLAGLEEQRVRLMELTLLAEPGERDAVIQADYRLPFRSLLQQQRCADQPVSVVLKPLDEVPDMRVFAIETANDGWEQGADQPVLYCGGNPSIRLCA